MSLRLSLASTFVGELFTGAIVYQIPSYQRPYEWGADEALQLLDDVMQSAAVDSDVPGDPDYFLGTVMLLAEPSVPPPGPDYPEGRPETSFQLIDGQQRLTTLTVLFAVLRDLDPATASALHELIIAPARGRAKPRPRIVPDGEDGLFFQAYVQEPGATLRVPDLGADALGTGSRNLLAVRDALSAQLVQLSTAERQALAKYLLGNCHVAVTLSHDIDRAHRMFVVLNERGRPLRRNDIIKVEVLKGLSPDDTTEATRLWHAAERLLGADYEVFFSHLKAVYGRHSRQTVVTGLRAMIAETGGAMTFVETMLLPYAAIYALISRCCRTPPQDGDALAVHLHYLGRLAGDDWIPAAMVALKQYEHEPGTAIELVRGIDRINHLMRVLCQGRNKRVTRFNRVMKAIRSGEARSADADVFRLSREELRSAKFNLRSLHRRNQAACKLLLLRINDELAGAMAPVDPSQVSVEHVLPKSPSWASGWRVLFADPDMREAATECFGNLALIPAGLNDRIKNSDFPEKQQLLSEHLDEREMLAITRDVISAPKWDYPAVTQREVRMLEVLSRLLGVELGDAAMRVWHRDQDVA